jgi:hypothetical protein
MTCQAIDVAQVVRIQVVLHGWNSVDQVLYNNWVCVPRVHDKVMGDDKMYEVSQVVWNPGPIPVVHVWLVEWPQ